MIGWDVGTQLGGGLRDWLFAEEEESTGADAVGPGRGVGAEPAPEHPDAPEFVPTGTIRENFESLAGLPGQLQDALEDVTDTVQETQETAQVGLKAGAAVLVVSMLAAAALEANDRTISRALGL